LVGIFVFITALTTKSLRRGRKKGGKGSKSKRNRKIMKKKTSTSALEQVPVTTLLERTASTDSSGPMRRPTSTPSRDGNGDGNGNGNRQDYTIGGLNIV
jgi:hypothetical protein